MSEKKYTEGFFINLKSGQYGEFIDISIQADKFCEWIKANKNSKGYVNITAYKNNKEGSKNTHYSFLNTYEFKNSTKETPKSNEKNGNTNTNATTNGNSNHTANNNGYSDNLPF